MCCGKLMGTMALWEADLAVFQSCFQVRWLQSVTQTKRQEERSRFIVSSSFWTTSLETIQQPWILSYKWAGVREALKQLADSLTKYLKYLSEKTDWGEWKSQLTSTCKTSITGRGIREACEANTCLTSSWFAGSPIQSRELYSSIYFNDFLPADRRWVVFAVYYIL